MKSSEIREVVLGGHLSLEEYIAVVRYGAKVSFSEEYCERVKSCRRLVEKWVTEERVMYGTTTGFGSLVSQVIPKEDAEILQRNIVITHSTSVGEPLDDESVRGIMLVAVNALGKGVSGVRLELLELYRDMLNCGVIPRVPKHGSVGYLCLEAHCAAAAIGYGQAKLSGGEFKDSKEVLKEAGLEPITLSYKEGLALVNGTLSPTAIGSIAIYDLINAAVTADVVGAVSLEALGGLIKAYDPRAMGVRPEAEQAHTAENLLALLKDSEVVAANSETHVQDALSLRCMPQAHGAVKRMLENSREIMENELNGVCDNPIFFAEGDDGVAISNGNPDAGYQGMAMDSACIAATYLAKMSERRNTRFIDTNLSKLPAYLVKTPGLNSGLMIPQYSQAGILNEMRTLSMPAVVDNVTTSGNQEDYVTMGYNACRKAQDEVPLLEYVLAIELLSAYQAQQFLPKDQKRGKGTAAVLEKIGEHVEVMSEDRYIYPDIETIKELIHNGEILAAAETATGKLKRK